MHDTVGREFRYKLCLILVNIACMGLKWHFRKQVSTLKGELFLAGA